MSSFDLTGCLLRAKQDLQAFQIATRGHHEVLSICRLGAPSIPITHTVVNVGFSMPKPTRISSLPAQIAPMTLPTRLRGWLFS